MEVRDVDVPNLLYGDGGALIGASGMPGFIAAAGWEGIVE
jgi:hypothetical protein